MRKKEENAFVDPLCVTLLNKKFQWSIVNRRMEIYQNYHHDGSVIYQLISSTHKKVGEDAKIRRVRREERKREQEKA